VQDMDSSCRCLKSHGQATSQISETRSASSQSPRTPVKVPCWTPVTN
jgi:hypothetical protein